MGEVVQFPYRRTCYLCQHLSIEARCQIFDEPIVGAVAANLMARDCNAYEPVGGR